VDFNTKTQPKVSCHFVSGGENPMKFHNFSAMFFKPYFHLRSGGKLK